MNDSQHAYGPISKALHWSMAGLFLLQFASSGAKRVWGKENVITELLGPHHANIGIMLLALVIVRIAWAFRQRQNRPVHTGPQGKLVTRGHLALYALMLLVPVAAVLIRLGTGKPLTFFGFALLPAGEGIAWAKEVGFTLHKPLAWVLAASIAGHIGMALYHRFVKRDDSLARITLGKATR